MPCEWNAVSYTTCKSTCENYYKACDVDQGSACDGYDGVGPSDTCTGGAARTFTGSVMAFVAIAVAIATIAVAAG